MISAKELNQITRIAKFNKEYKKDDLNDCLSFILDRMQKCANAGSFCCGMYEDDPNLLKLKDYSQNKLYEIYELLRFNKFEVKMDYDFRESSAFFTIFWEK